MYHHHNHQARTREERQQQRSKHKSELQKARRSVSPIWPCAAFRRLPISPPTITIDDVLSFIDPLFIVTITSWWKAGSITVALALTLPSDLTQPIFPFPSNVLCEFNQC
jgi:hypothetical protein